MVNFEIKIYKYAYGEVHITLIGNCYLSLMGTDSGKYTDRHGRPVK